MNNNLEQIINEHLFLPLSDEVCKQLNEVSNSLAAAMDDAMFKSCVYSMFISECNIKFKIGFLSKYKEEFETNLELPTIVYLILQTYVLFLVFKSETIGSSKKVEYSLIVKNYAVLRKGSWNNLICQDWIISMYSYYRKCASKPIDSSKSYSTLLNAIVPCRNWDETTLDISDVNVYNQLRSLCAAGYRGRLSSYIESEPFVSIDNPFAQIYLLAKKMVVEWNWKYISANPVIKLSEVFGANGKKRKKLGKFVDDIRGCLKEADLYKPSEDSSVLLRSIFSKEYYGLQDQMLSVLEFGIYIYYELLLETSK